MFEQVLDPVANSLFWSAALAAAPLMLLFVLLGVFRIKAHIATVASLALSTGKAFARQTAEKRAHQ